MDTYTGFVKTAVSVAHTILEEQQLAVGHL